MLKRWLVVSLLLNAAFIVARFGPLVRDRFAANRTTQTFSRFHVQRVAVFEGLPVPKGGVLFFGDSLIENCEWSELLGLPVANRGISGDGIASLLAAVPALGSLRETGTIFVIAGLNDLGQGIEGQAFLTRYRALIGALRTAAPNARILIHGILPVNPALDDSLRPLPSRIRAANAGLSALASAVGARFLDASSAFADASGLMDRRYTIDGLHLNGKGYQIWADQLRPVLMSPARL